MQARPDLVQMKRKIISQSSGSHCCHCLCHLLVLYKAGDHGSMILPRSMAFCSFSPPAFLGRPAKELGFGSGMTCWRRLRDWQAQGVWDRLHLALLTKLRQHDQIDWSRASIDAASVASPRGGQETGRNPTDRGKLGASGTSS